MPGSIIHHSIIGLSKFVCGSSTGNQLNSTAKIAISISPSQKLGIEMPASAKNRLASSPSLPRRIAA